MISPCVAVDDFYNDYVNELELRNSRKMSLSGAWCILRATTLATAVLHGVERCPQPAELCSSAGPLPSFSSPNSLQVPALTSSMLMEPVQQQQLQPQFQQQSSSFLPSSFLPGQGGLQQQKQQQPPQYPQQLSTFGNNILGMPSIPSSSNGPTL